MHLTEIIAVRILYPVLHAARTRTLGGWFGVAHVVGQVPGRRRYKLVRKIVLQVEHVHIREYIWIESNLKLNIKYDQIQISYSDILFEEIYYSMFEVITNFQ